MAPAKLGQRIIGKGCFTAIVTVAVVSSANEAFVQNDKLSSSIFATASKVPRLRSTREDSSRQQGRSHDVVDSPRSEASMTSSLGRRNLGNSSCVEDGEIAKAAFTHIVGEPREFLDDPVDDGSACCSGYCTELEMTSSTFLTPVLDEDGNELDPPEFVEEANGFESCHCGPYEEDKPVGGNNCTANGDEAKVYFNHTIGEPRIFYPAPVDDGSACCSGYCEEIMMTSSKFFVPVLDEDGDEVEGEYIEMAGGWQKCLCGEEPPSSATWEPSEGDDNIHTSCTEDGQEVSAYFNHTIGEPKQFYPNAVDDGSECCSGHCIDLWSESDPVFVDGEVVEHLAQGLETCLCGPSIAEERRGDV